MNRLYFDLETTSAEKDTCRIIQLAIKQVDDAEQVLINKSKMYNPGVPITPNATEAHGITDEMVKDCPSFYPDAKKLKKLFEDSILIGYNIIVFDLPVLMYEFDRAKIEVNISRNVIDVMKLETQLSPRTLSAVYERYTGEALTNAHDALADVIGTETVLDYQIKKIKKNGLDKKEIILKAGLPQDAADFFGKLKYDKDGDLIFNFGKNKDLKVKNEMHYANWILDSAFPSQVKKLIREEQLKNTKKQFTHPTPNKSIIDFAGRPTAYQPSSDELPF